MTLLTCPDCIENAVSEGYVLGADPADRIKGELSFDRLTGTYICSQDESHIFRLMKGKMVPARIEHYEIRGKKYKLISNKKASIIGRNIR